MNGNSSGRPPLWPNSSLNGNIRVFATNGGHMPEYRRKRGSDVWHWCKNCSKWPTSDYESTYTKPTSGELDNECKSKDSAGTCRT